MTFTISDVLSIISLLAGAVSIALAIVAMSAAKKSEKESRENFINTQKMMTEIFEKTQKMMTETYDKTKNALHEIDKKSCVIEDVTQKQLMQITQLFSNVLDYSLKNQEKESTEIKPIPINGVSANGLYEANAFNYGREIGQQMATQLLPELIKNPDSLENLVIVSEKLKDMSAKGFTTGTPLQKGTME